MTLTCVLPAGADDSSTALGIFPAKSNVANLAIANPSPLPFPGMDYYFKFNQSGGGGINAVHISSTSALDSTNHNYGDVTTTTSQSGTFYITDTGGRGYQDNAILLVAVKGDIPGNFTIHLKSSGYSWTPPGVMNAQPELSAITYHEGAIDTTFTKSQFVYGPQTWRPAGNNEPSDYPLYYGQDTTDATNTYKLMFVDLKAGPLGANGDLDITALQNYGAIRVDYSIENLDTVATFNVYCWNDNTTQGHGISWSNGLTSGGSVPSMVSGYTVLGPAYADYASEFPTSPGSTPVYHGPNTTFTANITNGAAPLTVQFNDTTVQSVKSWSWDFGDGSTSTEQNPVHVYSTAGTYTVSLTAANNKDITTTKTETDYITVTSSGGSSSGGGSSDSGDLWTSKTSARVNFTSNVTSGIFPLRVRFTDFSIIQNITGWSWDFNGDNIPDSSEQNTTYLYKAAGNYSVTLTVHTADGKTYNLTRTKYIRVADTASFDSDIGWISSDEYDPGDASSGAGQGAASPGVTVLPSATVKGTDGNPPLGAKVAETLLDAIIVIGVVGAGIVIWRKM